METTSSYTVIHRDELPRDDHVFEFEGFRYASADVSFIWVDMPPGGTIRLHKHPYMEIFIVQEGVSTFIVGTATIEAQAGQVILVPANVPHKFSNTGDTQLKQVDIHVSKKFITEWIEN